MWVVDVFVLFAFLEVLVASDGATRMFFGKFWDV